MAYVKRTKSERMTVLIEVDAENLPQQLQAIRKERGLSQNDVAKLANMTVQNVQKIEQGYARQLPFKTLKAICQALNYPVNKLLEEEELLESIA